MTGTPGWRWTRTALPSGPVELSAWELGTLSELGLNVFSSVPVPRPCANVLFGPHLLCPASSISEKPHLRRRKFSVIMSHCLIAIETSTQTHARPRGSYLRTLRRRPTFRPSQAGRIERVPEYKIGIDGSSKVNQSAGLIGEGARGSGWPSGSDDGRALEIGGPRLREVARACESERASERAAREENHERTAGS